VKRALSHDVQQSFARSGGLFAAHCRYVLVYTCIIFTVGQIVVVGLSRQTV